MSYANTYHDGLRVRCRREAQYVNENAKHYRLKKAWRAYDACLAKMETTLAAVTNAPASTFHGAAIKLAADLTFRDEETADIPAVFALYRDLTKIIGHDYVAAAERRMSDASKKGYADAAALPGLRVGPVEARKAVRS